MNGSYPGFVVVLDFLGGIQGEPPVGTGGEPMAAGCLTIRHNG